MLNSLTMKMGLDDDIDQQQTYFNQNTSKKWVLTSTVLYITLPLVQLASEVDPVINVVRLFGQGIQLLFPADSL